MILEIQLPQSWYAKNRRSACLGLCSQSFQTAWKKKVNKPIRQLHQSLGGARKKLEFDMLAESLSARKHPRARGHVFYLLFKSLFHLCQKKEMRIFWHAAGSRVQFAFGIGHDVISQHTVHWRFFFWSVMSCCLLILVGSARVFKRDEFAGGNDLIAGRPPRCTSPGREDLCDPIGHPATCTNTTFLGSFHLLGVI